jgi:hypothetical protein
VYQESVDYTQSDTYYCFTFYRMLYYVVHVSKECGISDVLLFHYLHRNYVLRPELCLGVPLLIKIWRFCSLAFTECVLWPHPIQTHALWHGEKQKEYEAANILTSRWTICGALS